MRLPAWSFLVFGLFCRLSLLSRSLANDDFDAQNDALTQAIQAVLNHYHDRHLTKESYSFSAETGLSIKDLARLSRVNKEFNAVMQNDPSWEVVSGVLMKEPCFSQFAANAYYIPRGRRRAGQRKNAESVRFVFSSWTSSGTSTTLGSVEDDFSAQESIVICLDRLLSFRASDGQTASDDGLTDNNESAREDKRRKIHVEIVNATEPPEDFYVPFRSLYWSKFSQNPSLSQAKQFLLWIAIKLNLQSVTNWLIHEQKTKIDWGHFDIAASTNNQLVFAELLRTDASIDRVNARILRRSHFCFPIFNLDSPSGELVDLFLEKVQLGYYHFSCATRFGRVQVLRKFLLHSQEHPLEEQFGLHLEHQVLHSFLKSIHYCQLPIIDMLTEEYPQFVQPNDQLKKKIFMCAIKRLNVRKSQEYFTRYELQRDLSQWLDWFEDSFQLELFLYVTRSSVTSEHVEQLLDKLGDRFFPPRLLGMTFFLIDHNDHWEADDVKRWLEIMERGSFNVDKVPFLKDSVRRSVKQLIALVEGLHLMENDRPWKRWKGMSSH